MAAKPACSGLFAYSRDDSTPSSSCVRDAAYADVLAICEGYGARLCTVQEHSSDCTKPVKCSLNDQKVWSIHSEDFPTANPRSLAAAMPNIAETAMSSGAPSPTPSSVPSSAPSDGEAPVARANQKWATQTNPTPVTAIVPVESTNYGMRWCCSDSYIWNIIQLSCFKSDLWVYSRDVDGECVR